MVAIWNLDSVGQFDHINSIIISTQGSYKADFTEFEKNLENPNVSAVDLHSQNCVELS